MLKVTLINHTPEPEKTVAAAARLCYSPLGAAEIMDNFSPEQVDKFLTRLIQMGHFSPIEHVTFTFAIEGVSRALSHQLVRHRIASYSQKSQRYVAEDSFAFIVPPSIRNNPEALAVYEETMEQIREAYSKLAKVVPKEDARYILPNACETKLVATFNARSLHNFLRLRCCQRAQWEIRELAEKMLAEVRKVAPRLFALAGPSCEVEGVCYEGDMSCGRAPLIEDLVAGHKGKGQGVE
ncbi:MAG: FAD-dependent thymidylate synthase [bacterium]|mgnify:CR=1 FL=1|nr:FAD-dependent thymidylate synthase [Bacillota bacterium]HHW55479.1 FAD-dependent thymidylate synthase [Bacillota bacterium]